MPSRDAAGLVGHDQRHRLGPVMHVSTAAILTSGDVRRRTPGCAGRSPPSGWATSAILISLSLERLQQMRRANGVHLDLQVGIQLREARRQRRQQELGGIVDAADAQWPAQIRCRCARRTPRHSTPAAGARNRAAARRARSAASDHRAARAALWVPLSANGTGWRICTAERSPRIGLAGPRPGNACRCLHAVLKRPGSGVA